MKRLRTDFGRESRSPVAGADGDLLGGVIVCRDITQIKEEEFFRHGQSRVLEMIAADAPLAGGSYESCPSHGRAGRRTTVFHPSFPSRWQTCTPRGSTAFSRSLCQGGRWAPIGPRNGSCGTAMYTRRPVVVTDVMTDPLWTDYRELAKICGLSACWSTPILSPQGDVLGSFAMYREEKRGPRPEENRLTEIATHIAGIAIERQRQQEILRERDARISLVADRPISLSGFCIQMKRRPG